MEHAIEMRDGYETVFLLLVRLNKESVPILVVNRQKVSWPKLHNKKLNARRLDLTDTRPRWS